jgi:hypothetical protein
MKIKLIITVVAVYMSVTDFYAQEFKISADNTKDGKLSLVNFMGDLPIEGYSGKEIIVTSTSEPIAVPERAKGLKPVFAAGYDNTGIGLSAEKNGNTITLTCLLPITRKGEYKIKVPENLSIRYESACERGGNITVQNVNNEVEIKTCHSITLKNVSGPVVLSTIAGNVDVIFSDGITPKPCSISSIGGEIDVTLPAKTGVNLELKSIAGNIYSDFEFPQTQEKQLKQVGGNNIVHKLNGGGIEFSLVTVGGSIYLRKGK